VASFKGIIYEDGGSGAVLGGEAETLAALRIASSFCSIAAQLSVASLYMLVASVGRGRTGLPLARPLEAMGVLRDCLEGVGDVAPRLQVICATRGLLKSFAAALLMCSRW